MSWVQISNTKTGEILCDTRVNVTHLKERGMVTDSKGINSFVGPVVDESVVYTINDSSVLSDWLKTDEAARYGFNKKAVK
jgi:hypothetical protein